MSFWSIAGTIIGTIIAPGTGTAIGAAIGGSMDAKKAATEQKSAQKKAAAAAASAANTLAGENAALTTQQMQLQVGQRKIASLEEALMNQANSPRVLTLPSNQPAQTQVDKINAWIDSVLRG